MTDINKKIAIFGGSFDPFHNSHRELTENLCKRFDEVIVVPGYQTPFKVGTKSASVSDRLAMLNLALSGMTNVTISDFEINRKTISYSIDTAKAFEGKGKLYWVIGSEMLIKLCDWRKIDELKRLVIFYIVGRPGFEIKNLDRLEENNIAYEISDFQGSETSSSKIKIDIAFGKDPDLPESVYEYVLHHGLYNDYKYIVDGYTEFHMKPSRIVHSYNVALTAVELAKRFGVNVDKAITAALLHDIGKYLDEEEIMRRGLTDDEPIKPCRHAGIGAQIALKYFGINDEEILNAIRFHTVGNKDMDDLAKIIFIADYIEPGRDFEGLEEIRNKAKTDLNGTLVMILKNTVNYLQGREIHKDTIETLNFFNK